MNMTIYNRVSPFNMSFFDINMKRLNKLETSAVFRDVDP